MPERSVIVIGAGLDRFYMAGQWVTPAGGVPPCLFSGRHAIEMLCRDDGELFGCERGEHLGDGFLLDQVFEVRIWVHRLLRSSQLKLQTGERVGRWEDVGAGGAQQHVTRGDQAVQLGDQGGG